MPETDFALIEEGTSRAILFWDDGSSAIRTIDGSWISAPRKVADVVMPGELGDFHAASSVELSALDQEAAASSLEMPKRSKEE